MPVMNPTSCRPVRRRRGFSLPELMAVVVIMGVIAAMAAPRMTRWLHTISQGSASNQIVADLGWSRAFAAREGRSVSLRVVSPTTYAIVVDNSDRELKRVDLSQLNTATRFDTGVGERVAFDSRGLYSSGNSTTTEFVVLRGALADTVRVTLVGRPYRAK